MFHLPKCRRAMFFSPGSLKLPHIFQDDHNVPDFIRSGTHLLKQLFIQPYTGYVLGFFTQVHTSIYKCRLCREEECTHTLWLRLHACLRHLWAADTHSGKVFIYISLSQQVSVCSPVFILTPSIIPLFASVTYSYVLNRADIPPGLSE